MEISLEQYEAFMQDITNGLSIETASWNAGISPKYKALITQMDVLAMSRWHYSNPL
jgi:hypothetical protein